MEKKNQILFVRLGAFGFMAGRTLGTMIADAGDMGFGVDEVSLITEKDLPREYRHSARWVIETDALARTGPNSDYVLVRDFEGHPVGKAWKSAYSQGQ